MNIILIFTLTISSFSTYFSKNNTYIVFNESDFSSISPVRDLIFELHIYNVDTIPFGAFISCSELLNISFSNSLTLIETCAFSECSKLVNLQLPNSLIAIGDDAFSRCYQLQQIKLPTTLTTIAMFAFQYCTQLQNIIFPKSLTMINSYAFRNCSSLNKVIFNGSCEPEHGINIFINTLIETVYVFPNYQSKFFCDIPVTKLSYSLTYAYHDIFKLSRSYLLFL